MDFWTINNIIYSAYDKTWSPSIKSTFHHLWDELESAFLQIYQILGYLRKILDRAMLPFFFWVTSHEVTKCLGKRVAGGWKRHLPNEKNAELESEIIIPKETQASRSRMKKMVHKTQHTHTHTTHDETQGSANTCQHSIKR